MALPAPDPGIAELVSHWPCMIRRWLGKGGNASVFPDYDLFPWKGQFQMTPRGTPTRWTTDDTTLTPGV